MFGLSLGVQKISDVLPGMVYALLSGLNSATVGLVALAAVQVSEQCPTFNRLFSLTCQACRESNQRPTLKTSCDIRGVRWNVLQRTVVLSNPYRHWRNCHSLVGRAASATSHATEKNNTAAQKAHSTKHRSF